MRKLVPVFLIAVFCVVLVSIVDAWDTKRYLNGSYFDQTVYFVRDTNNSGGLDTNASGMQYDTIFGYQLSINLCGYDKARYFYTLDATGATDHTCTLFNCFYWGSDDTNRQLRTALYVDTVECIDSTYDSTFCLNADVLDSDSLMFLDWLQHRLIIGMHVWDDDDTNAAGRLNETATAVKIRNAVIYLDED